MLAAAEVFLLAREGNGPYCAKLHHHNDKRCIFRHSGRDPTTPSAAQHLARLVGRARALEIMLSADDSDAVLAQR